MVGQRRTEEAARRPEEDVAEPESESDAAPSPAADSLLFLLYFRDEGREEDRTGC
jgi:hypothetical protein